MPPWMIEELKRQEQERERSRDAERPRVELPVSSWQPAVNEEQCSVVVVINL